MFFNSIEFIVFILLTGLIYFAFPAKFRIHILLISSLLFYAFFSLKHFFFPIVLMVSTFVPAIMIGRSQNERQKNAIYLFALIFNITFLLVFKYAGFFIESFSDLFGSLSGKTVQEGRFSIADKLIIPLGISYVIFQCIGYLIDVKSGEVPPTKNIVHFMVYLFYFPKVVSGPVERSSFIERLKHLQRPTQLQFSSGLNLFLWGAFKKTVVADRLGAWVDFVYSDLTAFGGVTLIVVSLLFTIQLYADFSGYTDMAIGISKCFGISLTRNFNLPLLSVSVTDFWRRWHISLSNWITEYIYMPLAVGTRNMGKSGIFLSFMLTFIILGLWHGPNWTFVIFGVLQGLLLSFEFITAKTRKKWKKQGNVLASPMVTIPLTYLFVSFSLVFFRSQDLNEAYYVISNLGGDLLTGIRELVGHKFGSDRFQMLVLAISVPMMFWTESLQKRKPLSGQIMMKNTGVQVILYSAFIMIIVGLCYIETTSRFIYFKF